MRMSKPELLTAIDKGWQDFNDSLATLDPVLVSTATDAAGWTILDHIVHISVWEAGIHALLNGQDRAAAMGLDRDMLYGGDFDKMNAIIREQNQFASIDMATQFVMGTHDGFVAKIASLSEDDLYKPYRHYQPDTEREAPIIDWIKADTYEHYAEHQKWIAVIADAAPPVTRAQLVAFIQRGWTVFNQYIDSLTEEQLTVPTDAAGWTAKDHVMHLAVWEDGIDALLNRQDRAARMGITDALLDSHDYDKINAAIQQQHKDLSLADVRQRFDAIHQRFIASIESLSDEELHKPYQYFNPVSANNNPVIGYIEGNSEGHYAEHRPWIAAIVSGE
ncbi:MAG: ClbS/DfsB family four-helix bundle protein [Anaerolineae bacterium]